nr:sodium/potassium/calcium exchanger 1-like isoform X1 [Ipomoea batatas]
MFGKFGKGSRGVFSVDTATLNLEPRGEETREEARWSNTIIIMGCGESKHAVSTENSTISSKSKRSSSSRSSSKREKASETAPAEKTGASAPPLAGQQQQQEVAKDDPKKPPEAVVMEGEINIVKEAKSQIALEEQKASETALAQKTGASAPPLAGQQQEQEQEAAKDDPKKPLEAIAIEGEINILKEAKSQIALEEQKGDDDHGKGEINVVKEGKGEKVLEGEKGGDDHGKQTEKALEVKEDQGKENKNGQPEAEEDKESKNNAEAVKVAVEDVKVEETVKEQEECVPVKDENEKEINKTQEVVKPAEKSSVDDKKTDAQKGLCLFLSTISHHAYTDLSRLKL